jgi:hypothetical protein
LGQCGRSFQIHAIRGKFQISGAGYLTKNKFLLCIFVAGHVSYTTIQNYLTMRLGPLGLVVKLLYEIKKVHGSIPALVDFAK